MGIQPIDLQVMYAQSANVSKMAGNAQVAQLSESIMQQTTVVQNNLENSKRVHSATDDKAQNTKVDNEKSGGSSGGFASGKKSGEQDSNEPEENGSGNSVSMGPKYLGSIIDIVG